MSSVTYLNGQTLNTTALTQDQISKVFQVATCQMLGIAVFSVGVVLTQNSDIAIPISMANLAVGQILTGTNIPQGTTILSVNLSTITMSNSAFITVTNDIVVSEPLAFSKVRVDWQQQGQPAWQIDTDTCFLRCETQDTDYSRLRDSIGSYLDPAYTRIDTYTRSWRVYWTFYGPNSLNNSKFIQSGLITLDFIAALLAESNIYIQPSIIEPHRFRELFQGQWWERVDMQVEFNEQITETINYQTVESVEVEVYNSTGKVLDFTVES